MIAILHLLLAVCTFVYGAVVGSFLNVCIYRIPWEKSLIWPGSRCPRCLSAIAPGDNVPIFGWIRLRGRCRRCSAPISPRYPLIEAAVAFLFVLVYLVDVVYGPRDAVGWPATILFLRAGYHQLLLSFLIVATFIDYDYFLIPDRVTVVGMVLGVSIGAIFPEIRPEPAEAFSTWNGFSQAAIAGSVGFAAGWAVQALAFELALQRKCSFPPALGLLLGFVGWRLGLSGYSGRAGSLVVGIDGLLIGGAIVWSIRIVGGILFRKEAMGFGDVTLMAMIGAFLGWQPLPLVLFSAAFLGLGHALIRAAALIVRWFRGGRFRGLGKPIPFGPYLGMAAATLMLGWPWIWSGWARNFYDVFGVVCSWLWDNAWGRPRLGPP